MNATTGIVGKAESSEGPFERLYAENFQRVAAYLLARTDRDSAGEAVARTFEIAWRRLDDVPVEPVPWLLGVARRVLAEQRRADGRRSRLFERLAENVPQMSGDHAEEAVVREVTLAAIGGLTDAQREVLLLIAWDGLSEREAAAVLGCSRRAVALRLHRARKQLRAALGPTAGESNLIDDAPPNSRPPRPVSRASQETT